MDYSVGSLADLISGTNTPNKPKVVKKSFKKSNDLNLKEEPNNKSEKKTKPIKTGKVKIPKEINETKVSKDRLSNFNGNSLNEKPVKKRSHKQISTEKLDDGESSPPKKMKLNKNEQNAERRVKKKIKEEKKVHDPEELERTIFVGNIPITCDKKKIKKHFKKYGEIDTVRIRGIPVADLKVSKKVAAIKKDFNPNRSNVFCFIRFADKESVLKAEAENGLLFEGHHLRVHSAVSNEKPDETRAIFVGNLSFNAIEDELWKLFESCGPIAHVRIVRDSHTGMGKGFGYVNFKDSDAVQLALEMENVKLNDRELRISLCNLNTARKNKKNNKNKKITQPGKGKQKKRFNQRPNAQSSENSQTEAKQVNKEFQGTKFSEKKKHKVNKGLLEKKKIMKKIAPKLK